MKTEAGNQELQSQEVVAVVAAITKIQELE